MIALITNASQWYKMYTTWMVAVIALLNILVEYSDTIQTIIPKDDLPYWNVGLAIATGILRQVHQPAIQTATPVPANPPTPEKAP